jgi:hypothetical protein
MTWAGVGGQALARRARTGSARPRGGPEHACRGCQAAVARPGGRSGRSRDGQRNLAAAVRLQAARERLARRHEREYLDGAGQQLAAIHQPRERAELVGIIDLHLDVVQVSRILGHASVSTTLDVYAHLFDEARHAADIRARMAGSAFAGLLTPEDDRTVIVLPAAVERGEERLSAREQAGDPLGYLTKT